jgi:hypothetical protein
VRRAIASRSARRRAGFVAGVAVLVGPVALLAPSSSALAGGNGNAGLPAALQPNKLLVSISHWQQNANITAGTTQLPPGCSTAPNAPDPCVTAQAGGDYPYTFNNDGTDGSFGVTQPILLEEINPSSGKPMVLLVVPNSTTTNGDQLVTSFSSKSEVALNQSTNGNDVTFMGYVAPVAAIDVSNSNTPGVVDPTNSAGPNAYYRAVAVVNRAGQFQFTETNAYSGNNGRAAILNSTNDSFYTAGNAGNGGNPEPQGVVEGAGSQILAASSLPESSQKPGDPTPLGNFNILQLPMYTTADKSAKDDNFRGLSVSNGVIYMTKGSGSNGIDTVYFVDTTGTACPTNTSTKVGGVGLPASGATLPSASTWASPSFSSNDPALGLTAGNPGLTPTNMCVLNGFPTDLAKGATNSSLYPFGIWFANPDTLYVADEGSGDNTYSTGSGTYAAAGGSATAGLQKWVFDGTEWKRAYTIQSGLNLGIPYQVAKGPHGQTYPTGDNSYIDSKGKTQTGPWAPGNDGLRNLTGRVSANGTVTLWATTSTVSWSGDQGADPNSLVTVTDNLAATSLPSHESFSTVIAPDWGQVVRGVSFSPGTKQLRCRVGSR